MKFTSKILVSLLLCAALLIGILPMTAFAEKSVTEVNVLGFKEPEKGQTAGENLKDIACPEGANYTIEEAFWVNVSMEDTMEDDDEFEYGKTYYLIITVAPAEGYEFTDVCPTYFDGSDRFVDFDEMWIYYDGTLIVYSTNFPLIDPSLEKIENAYLTGYTMPMAGKTAAETALPAVPADAPYTVSEAYWYDEYEEELLDTDATFVKGQLYSLCVVLVSDEGYTFTDDTAVFVDGSTDDIDFKYSGFSAEDSAYIVWLQPTYPDFEGDPDEVTEIDVTVDQFPVVGITLADLPAPYCEAGSGFEVGDWHWINATAGEPMNDDDVFEAGKDYVLFVIVDNMPGFEIAENVTFTINGDAELVGGTRGDSFESVPMKAIDIIDSVDVGGVKLPEAGLTAGESLANVFVPDDAPYEIDEVSWVRYTEEDVEKMAESDAFEAGKTYCLFVSLAPADGYVFYPYADATVNGDAALVDDEYTDTDDYGFLIFCSVDIPLEDSSDVLYGDVFSDGAVNKKDSLALRRYLADNSEPIDVAAADVFYDGTINKKDSLLLKQYLAGWAVVLGPEA